MTREDQATKGQLTEDEAVDLMVIDYAHLLSRNTWCLLDALAVLAGYSPEADRATLEKVLLEPSSSSYENYRKNRRLMQHLIADFVGEDTAETTALEVRRPPRDWLRWAMSHKNEYEYSERLISLAESVVGVVPAAGESIEQARPKAISEHRLNWLKEWLRSNEIELPIPKSKGGKPGLKSRARKEALSQAPRLFTKATFDKAWSELPKREA